MGSYDMFRSLQGALRCCNDNEDYDSKEIGEEGWGRWVFRMVSCLPTTLYKPAYLSFYFSHSVSLILPYKITSATHSMLSPNHDYLNT